jgi:adenylate cyclase
MDPQGPPAVKVDVQPVVEWLLGDLKEASSELVLEAFGPFLIQCGVRVARIAAFVRTLHPEIMGRRFIWKRGTERVDVLHAPYALVRSPEYSNSPAGEVTQSGHECRWRLEGEAALPYVSLDELRAAGMTDYVGLPLHFLTDQVHAITFATDAKGGFSDGELEAIRYATKPLARIAEILSLERSATNLLDAYVGHHAGERILAGRVRRGETETIHCLIWFSDLRGFTTLSSQADPASTVEILNRLFDCQVPAVERHGGEVLKFIGDGMLAIFRVKDGSDAKAVARGALAAANEAFAALDDWNGLRAKEGASPLAFGLALHIGDVGYGNIGSAGRLDFTCIGSAVNVAARVEGLASKLGRRLLLTRAMAEVLEVPTRSLGAHELKGIAEAEVVHELA